MRSLGLDLSCTSTGIVCLQSSETKAPELLYAGTVKPKQKGMPRCSEIAEGVIAAIERFDPDKIAIEGYGGSFKSSIIPIVEVGTVVRYFLTQMQRKWIEPAPTQVKQFALGVGKGEKSQIMMAVFKRWGFEAKNDDEADAYVCSCIGLAHGGTLTGITQLQLEITGKVRSG